MNLLDNIAGNASQTFTIILDDASTVAVSLVFRPTIQRWTISLTYKAITINNLILSLHYNILNPWRGRLPFGLACLSADGVDPFQVNDFVDQRAALYVLNQVDLASIDTSLEALVA